MSGRRLWPLVAVGLVLLMLVPLACGRTPAGEKTIKIGAILPLSGGAMAQAAEQQQRGLKMALDEINAAGGVLGKQVELIIEDDKGDPSTGVAAAEKLITKDKVVALIGGYSSTITAAIMGAISKYEPVVVWAGASSTKVERDYGPKKWFFHIHPWDYHRQRTVANFLASVDPKPRTVALAYEDGVYGTTSADYARRYLKEVGLQVVFDEPFKSGSSDFTPLLTKVKKANPDVFYWVAYAGDTLLIMKQAKELDFNPKLFLTVAINFPEYKKSLGATGDWVAGVDVWVPGMIVKGQENWMEKYNRLYPNSSPEYWAPLAYGNLYTVVDAIKRAGTTEKGKLIEALEKTDLVTPLGRWTFRASEEGGLHQAISEQIITQWQEGKSVVVFPKEKANGEFKYPTPPWKQR